MIPIPNLVQALSQGDLDIVRNALEDHIKALTAVLTRSHRQGDLEWSRLVEERSRDLALFLETVSQHARRTPGQASKLLEQLVTSQTTSILCSLQGLDAQPAVVKLKISLENMLKLHAAQLSSLSKTPAKSTSNMPQTIVVSQQQSLSKSPAKSPSNVPQKSLSQHPRMTQIHRVRLERWSTLEDQEVVRESALDGTVLSMAQEYLVSSRSWTREDLEKQVHTWLQPVVENELRSKNLDRAKDILQNMGCDPWDEIKNICLKTSEVELRNYLAPELNHLQMLSAQENDVWMFINLVNISLKSAESCESKKQFEISEEFPRPETLTMSSVLQLPSVSAWMDNYISHLYFYTADSTLQLSLNINTCWKYLISNCETDLLRCWIELSFNAESPKWYGDQSPDFVEKISLQLRNWPITQQMIDRVEEISPNLSAKDSVLDYLSSYGKFATTERKNIKTILIRLARSHGLMRFGPDMGGDISWSEIKALLFEFCVEHNLPDLAVICRLQPEAPKEGWPLLYSHHWKLAQSPENLKLAVECLWRCVEYLRQQNVSADTVESAENRSLLVVATVLMNDQNLSLMFNEDTAEDLANDLALPLARFQTVEATYPLLVAAAQEVLWPSSPDIDLYALLQDCTTCNINCIFQWRMDKNRVRSAEDDGRWCDFPEFSSENLIARFGYNETLTLSYFLRAGRPSFAACSVLGAKALSSGRLPSKTLKGVCELAHGIALQHFSNSRVTASCVAFIELLGGSSATMRTQVAVANSILAYETARTGESEPSYDRVSMLLRDLSLGHQERSGREMHAILDRILQQKTYAEIETESEHFIKDKGSLLLEQGLEARFAALHRLPFPERFVRRCTRSGHWLIALLYCQIHGYPQSLVVEILEEIPDQAIRQHIRCALARKPAKVESAKSRPASSRPAHFSRSISRQEPSMSNSVVSKVSRDSFESEKSSGSGSEVFPTFHDCEDLLEVIVRCHCEQQPEAVLLYNAVALPNPTLALFAACYEPNWEIRGLCAWLAAWLPLPQRTQFSAAFGSRTWTAENTEQILTEALKEGLVVTIQKGFNIFLPDNPLKILSDILVDCIVKRSFTKTVDQLKRLLGASFEHKLKIRGCDHFIYEHSWLAKVTIKLCNTALIYCTTSARHQFLFLKALSDSEIAGQWSECNERCASLAKLELLGRVLESILPTDVPLDIEHWLSNPQEENKKCVDLLLQSEKYVEAVDLSKITKLPVDVALATQLSANLQQCLSETIPDLKQFWQDCDSKFSENDISAEVASNFYRQCALQFSSALDRFTALRLALQWLQTPKTGDEQAPVWRRTLTSATEVEALEKEMWLTCIQAGSAAIKELKEITEPTPLIQLNSASLNSQRSVFSEGADKGKSSGEVHKLIGHLLDMGDIAAACRVESLFSVRNENLNILLACLAIAEEKVKVGDCLPELLAEPLPSSPSSYAKSSYPREKSIIFKEILEADIGIKQAVPPEYVEIPSREKQVALAAIQKLSKLLSHGQRIGWQFAACYRLAMNLDIQFQDVLRIGEPLRLLRTALTEACWDQVVVASDLLDTFQLAPKQVAEFLSREIVSAIGKGAAQGCAQNCTVLGQNIKDVIARVIILAPDVALLAKELLHIARKQSITSPDTPRVVLVTVTELLIRSHYCYTSACDMEGIASVLSDAHRLTTTLTSKQEWTLMVRLLTGIQRYTEMSYIFRILKENKQFAFLLKDDAEKVNKGKSSKKSQLNQEDEVDNLLRNDSDKPAGLKVALFEWLRRECPEESELHKMAALHFGMYRELAGLRKSEAETRCQLAVDAKLVNSSKIVEWLNSAMQDFSQAAEHYLQADMLTHAVHCAHQAELTALQLFLVSTVLPDQPARRVLLLDSKSVAQLITNTLSFPQAKIVIRAYNHNTDWGSTLFHHCVATSLDAENYLAAWAASYELTPSILQDVALRFQRSAVITRVMGQNMRRILNYMQDIEVRYRVASQLGFKDVVQGMLRGVEVAYLKDTVWQSGFRN